MSSTVISFTNVFLSSTRGYTTPATSRRRTMDWTTLAHGAHDEASSQTTEKKREAFKES